MSIARFRGTCTHCGHDHDADHEMFKRVLAQSETTARDAIIEEVAKSIEAAPLTYAGPDPHVASDLRYLLVCAIRDMKGST